MLNHHDLYYQSVDKGGLINSEVISLSLNHYAIWLVYARNGRQAIIWLTPVQYTAMANFSRKKIYCAFAENI